MDKSTYSADFLDEHRDFNLHDNWWEYCYEALIEKAKAMGLTVGRNEIQFSGFWSQGDGASFEGVVEDLSLFLTANNLAGDYPRVRQLIELDSPPSLKLVRTHNHYSHQFTVGSEVDHDYFCDIMDCPSELHKRVADTWDIELNAEMGDLAGAFLEIARTMMTDLYDDLETTHDDLTSDESVTEALIANDIEEEDEDEDLEDAA